MTTTPAQRPALLSTLALGVLLCGSALMGSAQASETRSQRPSAKVVQQTQMALASPEQLAAAERVLVGQYDCEFGQRVSIDPHQSHPGYFNLRLGKQSWVMKPVLSQTGAIRLEDPKRGAMWLQLGNKSMLMSQQLGKRLADECMNADQLTLADEMKRNPPRGLLDPVDPPVAAPPAVSPPTAPATTN